VKSREAGSRKQEAEKENGSGNSNGNNEIPAIGGNVGAQHVVPIYPLGKNDNNRRGVWPSALSAKGKDSQQCRGGSQTAFWLPQRHTSFGSSPPVFCERLKPRRIIVIIAMGQLNLA
jgi:hypothetical protein